MSSSLKIVSLLLAAWTIASLENPPFALAEVNDLAAIDLEESICYMHTRDGQVVNLNKLCTGKDTPISLTDQRFLEKYQSLLRRRLSVSPAVQTALVQTQQNPQAAVQRAQAICTAIRTGQPQAQPPTELIDADIFDTIAPKYYCPELND